LLFQPDLLSMDYANCNAWFGQPDPVLQGNPLVQGTVAGPGGTDWGEGFVDCGLYGMTPLANTGYFCVGLSAIPFGSAEEELFTGLDHSYIAAEDAFIGLVAGRTSDDSDRPVFNIPADRPRGRARSLRRFAGRRQSASQQAAPLGLAPKARR